MKKIFITTVFGLLIQFSLVSQTKKDEFDVNHIDYKLLNNTFIEKVNQVRDCLKISKFSLDTKYGNMSRYQVNYMSEFDILTHTDEKKFQGVILKELLDRLNYFYKDLNPEFSMEICAKTNVQKNSSLTYESIVNEIVNSYLESPGHRMAILNTSNYYGVYINSSFRINSSKNTLYHSAFIFEN